MHKILPLFLIALVFLAFHPTADARETSGLPVPRFVSLKSDKVNVRVGPGDRYPISWIYRRKALPVEIVEEFDHWRKIRDFEGAEGWIHKGLLDGRRTVVITGATRLMRRAPEESSPPLLKVEPMVIGKLLECQPDWCRLQIDSRKGWLPKKHFWGAYKKEEF